MGESKKTEQEKAEEIILKDKIQKQINRTTAMKNEMNANRAFVRILIWLKYKWSDLIALFITLFITATVLAFTSRAIWEIIKMAFSLNH